MVAEGGANLSDPTGSLLWRKPEGDRRVGSQGIKNSVGKRLIPDPILLSFAAPLCTRSSIG